MDRRRRALAPLGVALVLTYSWDVTASDALVVVPVLLALAGVGAASRRRSTSPAPGT